MNAEFLRLLRNILLRGFVVGIVITLILGSVTVAAWPFWTGIARHWFHVDASLASAMVFRFFVDVRFLLLYFVLAPALAIHWTLKRDALGKG